MDKIKWATIIPLIGGMTIGNERATGSKPDFLISYNAFASNDAHARNHYKDVPFITIDETSNDFASNEDVDLVKAVGDIDFVSTVCPCAGLSNLNPKSNEDAEQNDWMYRSANFVLEKIKPKVFWGENAPALFTNKGKKVKQQLIEIGEKHGYTFSIVKTDTKLHGIPQQRTRSFYFFWRDTNPPIFEKIQKDYTPIAEYLKDVPKDASLQDVYANTDYDRNAYIKWINENPDFVEYITNSNKSSDRKIKTLYTYIRLNNKFDEFIEYFNKHGLDKYVKNIEYAKYKISLGKKIWNNTPNLVYGIDYINAVQGRIFSYTLHPTEQRYLNVREFMHLMGLPHDFELAHTKNLNQICQNVPVITAADWTSEVIAYIKGKRKIHNDIYFELNNTSDIDDDCDEVCSIQLF